MLSSARRAHSICENSKLFALSSVDLSSLELTILKFLNKVGRASAPGVPFGVYRTPYTKGSSDARHESKKTYSSVICHVTFLYSAAICLVFFISTISAWECHGVNSWMIIWLWLPGINTFAKCNRDATTLWARVRDSCIILGRLRNHTTAGMHPEMWWTSQWLETQAVYYTY